MQIIYMGDNLCEMTGSIIWESKEITSQNIFCRNFTQQAER